MPTPTSNEPNTADWFYHHPAPGFSYYDKNLHAACAVMLERGMGQWVYCTQWMSGTCLFRSPDGQPVHYVTVTRGGKVE